jgi:beta-phosphoglucomutase
MSPKPRDFEGNKEKVYMQMSLQESVKLGTVKAAILDVDGVALALPHEPAWREALSGFTDPNLFTTAVYLAHVAGKTRLVGALSALEALGVPDAGRLAVLYAERKQKWLEYLTQDGDVAAH